jgi:hypothetical protein
MRYIHPQQDDIANALASCDELAKKKPEEGQRCPTCGQVFLEGKQSLHFSLQSPSSEVEEVLASS